LKSKIASIASLEIYLKTKDILLWNHYYNALREPKIREKFVVTSEEQIQQTKLKLIKAGINVQPYTINVSGYHQFITKANYKHGSYGSNFPEKTLEHYVAADLLGLKPSDTYIDIASGASPVPEIYHELFGCKTYRQDLSYPLGIHGGSIGGDACSIPLENHSVDKMALHCSFEHFEGNADIGFLKEANRLLSSGGKVCVLPIYFFSNYAAQTNPIMNLKEFDKDMTVYCVKGWYIRYSRFYDVPHFIKRISGNLCDLNLTVYSVQNALSVNQNCYLQFAMILEKN